VQVDAQREIAAGSAREVEIRAGCIQAVEALRDALVAAHGPGTAPSATQLDWWLWAAGERQRAAGPPHHRTWTTCY
jgi:Potential Queuosine, Q, salvage protein family